MMVSGIGVRISAIKNFKEQITNNKQITMTEIQNSTRLSSSQAKQLVFDLI